LSRLTAARLFARRRRDACATDLGHFVHVNLQPLHRRRALRVIVVEERVEGDGVFHREPGIGDPFTEIFQRAAASGVGVELHDPRFDGVEAGLRRGCDNLDDAEVVAANGAGVEAVAEWLVGRALACGTRAGRLRLVEHVGGCLRGARPGSDDAERTDCAAKNLSTRPFHVASPAV